MNMKLHKTWEVWATHQHNGAAGRRQTACLPKAERRRVTQAISDTTRYRAKPQSHAQDEPTGYAAVSQTLSLTPSISSILSLIMLLLFCNWRAPFSPSPSFSLGLLQNGWTEGEEGTRGRRGEVNEIPMRCQGALVVRCGEWEKRPEGRGVAGLTVWGAGGHPAVPVRSPRSY